MSTRLARLIRLEQEIRKGNYPDVNMLCEKLEIQPRTLFADIKELRKRLGLQIKYDRYNNGYYNSDPTKQLPTFELSPEEINVLHLAKDMLLQYTGPSFEPIVHNAISKIDLRISDNGKPDEDGGKKDGEEDDGKKDSKENGKAFNAIYFAPFTAAHLSYKLLSAVGKACAEHKAMTITYQSPGSEAPTERTIYPYKIAHHQSSWYLCGFCRDRQAFKVFPLHRIKNYKIANEKFQAPTEPQIEEWLRSAFKQDLLVEHRG